MRPPTMSVQERASCRQWAYKREPLADNERTRESLLPTKSVQERASCRQWVYKREPLADNECTRDSLLPTKSASKTLGGEEGSERGAVTFVLSYFTVLIIFLDVSFLEPPPEPEPQSGSIFLIVLIIDCKYLFGFFPPYWPTSHTGAPKTSHPTFSCTPVMASSKQWKNQGIIGGR